MCLCLRLTCLFNTQAYQTDKPELRFTVTAVTVTVSDVNNHAPVINQTSYTAQVSEGSQVGSIVLVVAASDLDQVSTIIT